MSPKLLTLLRNILNKSNFQSVIQARRVATANAVEEKGDWNEDLISSKYATRYKTRVIEKLSPEKCDKNVDGSPEDQTEVKIKTRKVAMLLGYCGADYHGMQWCPQVRTIEEDLFKALLDAKYISLGQYNSPKSKAWYQRGSRTDAGVSAARQVVSIKISEGAKIEEINKRLPDCIRIFGIRKATKKFDSKNDCSSRTYNYILPTYAFDENIVTYEDKMAFRIAEEKLQEINRNLAEYVGIKCFHNFTVKIFHTDPSSVRNIISFGVDKLYIDSGMEFAVLAVQGQSFMLRQIRKMVGLTIAVMRGLISTSTFKKAFTKDKVFLPSAPGLGLLLDRIHYGRYNAEFKHTHEQLNWTEEEETIEKFKRDYIYPVIVKGEIEGNSMGRWLEKTSRLSDCYGPKESVAVEGIVPYRRITV